MKIQGAHVIRRAFSVALFGLFGLAMASGVGILAASALKVNDSGNPVLVLDRTEFDFGCVPAGPDLVASFEVQNAGARRLILRKLKGSCECLGSDPAPIIVEPGAKHTLTARVHTGDLNGAMKLDLFYRSSDPAHPQFTLSVLADVRGT